MAKVNFNSCIQECLQEAMQVCEKRSGNIALELKQSLGEICRGDFEKLVREKLHSKYASSEGSRSFLSKLQSHGGQKIFDNYFCAVQGKELGEKICFAKQRRQSEVFEVATATVEETESEPVAEIETGFALEPVPFTILFSPLDLAMLMQQRQIQIRVPPPVHPAKLVEALAFALGMTVWDQSDNCGEHCDVPERFLTIIENQP